MVFLRRSNPGGMGVAELISACARDRENPDLWMEFLHRYSHKIRQFVDRTCRAGAAIRSGKSYSFMVALGNSDLIQNTLLRLLENDCALMRRFVGTTEDEWITYLAVITRSVVRNSMLQDRRRRRGDSAGAQALPYLGSATLGGQQRTTGYLEADHRLLASEVINLCERTIRTLAGKHACRDLLIIRLLLSHGLSINQIAKCQGVNLSRKGVQKVINRLLDRVARAIPEGAYRSTSRWQPVNRL